jgi:hypothetical protein
MSASVRLFVIAAVGVPVALGAAALAANRWVGPTAAIGLAAVGCGLALAAGVYLATRRLAQADDRLRAAEQALESVPQAVFVLDSLQPGAPNRYVNKA